MKMNKAILAAAVTAAIGVGTAGQASASVYGGAGINISDLTVFILNDDSTLATIDSFDFRTITASDLNGVSGPGSIKSCSNGGGCGGPGAALVLDSSVSEIGTPVVPRVNNAFSFLGPANGGQYGSSDNVIWDANLVGDAATHVQGIAESELTTGTSAGATSTIRSTTGFTFNFTLAGTGSFFLDFMADPDLYAELIDASALSGTSSASLTTQFRLSGGDTATTITWSPNGTVSAGDCVVTGASGATCSENPGEDSQNLNASVSAPFGSSDTYSFDPLANSLSAFGIGITGLSKGTYSFTLAATQEANNTRNPIPEPGMLALFGLGLVGLGATARRNKKQS